MVPVSGVGRRRRWRVLAAVALGVLFIAGLLAIGARRLSRTEIREEPFILQPGPIATGMPLSPWPWSKIPNLSRTP